ncbi:hypothetical protein AXG93_3017s1280 [Marchantia polymorpha subsp. ruderalis]|uniref:Uncharacterized protein n=1 Tax=Marchantia polymorpha subsp. ruderalis TaxID=1480154 RepID=A0A176WGI2_MARPO|nr:hypothetical protein AXG93_3017s1280 [Marchantia polymorpha subsp. ruderalis]
MQRKRPFGNGKWVLPGHTGSLSKHPFPKHYPSSPTPSKVDFTKRPPFLNTDARNGASDCGATAPHATAQTGSQTTQTQASTLGDLKMALSRYCNEPLGVNRLHQKSGAEARLFELVGTTRKLPAGEWRAQ